MSAQIALRWAVVSAVLLLVQCRDAFQWSSADQFRASLRCRMSLDDVRTSARTLGADDVKPAAQHRVPARYEVRKRNTAFYLGFDRGQLLTVQQARFHGTTGVRLSVEENLCNGTRRGQFNLTVRAPARLAGANVFVDGELLTRLSTGAMPEASTGGLPDGSHEVRVEKPGLLPIVKRVTYRPRGYWLDDRDVTVSIADSEIKSLRGH